MRFSTEPHVSLLASALVAALALPLDATPVGTAFTYQGRLQYQGVPAQGLFDMEFTVYDGPDPDASNLVATNRRCAVSVDGGLLSVVLDFGDIFSGENLWLKIGVTQAGPCNGFTSFTILTPLQPITPAPYAVHAVQAQDALRAQDADTVDGFDAASFLRSEADPTVVSYVKDGVSWSELTGIPAGFADGVDNDSTGGTLNCYTTDWGARSDCGFGDLQPIPVPPCNPGYTFTGLAQIATAPTDCNNWTANVRLRAKSLCCKVE